MKIMISGMNVASWGNLARLPFVICLRLPVMAILLILHWIAEFLEKKLDAIYDWLNGVLPSLQPVRGSGPSPEVLAAQAALNAVRGKLRQQESNNKE